MRPSVFTLTLLLSVLWAYGQDPSVNKISRKEVTALPDEYPNGVYLMDSEADPNWSWPEDAGVILGLKWASSNSRHSQILLDRYANKMMIRGKDWGNNQWRAWNKVLVEYQNKVGIGTNSPHGNLDVRTPDQSGVITTFLSDASISSATEEHKWAIRTGRSFDYPNRTLDFGMVSDSYGQNPAFYVAPKGTEVFRVTEDGSVGIGASNPVSKLQVMGDISIDFGMGLRVDTDWNGAGGAYFLKTGYSGDRGGDVLDFYVPGNGSHHKEIKMSIVEQGNVGIGIDNPTHKLEVNGTIRSQEVKVEASPWPDYVFEPDYGLLTLEETEAYIKENKHLPEVPSAKEMEANGVQLGEMNRLLLKKIEELTLHLIAERRSNQQLRKEFESMKTDLESLLKSQDEK